MRDCQRCGHGETEHGSHTMLSGNVRAKLCLGCLNEFVRHIAENSDIQSAWRQATARNDALVARNSTVNPATEAEWQETIRMKDASDQACYAVSMAFIQPLPEAVDAGEDGPQYHTPTPYHVGPSLAGLASGPIVSTRDGKVIFQMMGNRPCDRVDAEFAARACNAHDDLVKALKLIVEYPESRKFLGALLYDDAQAALAKATP